jgi:acyl-CoA thioesterase-1
VSFLIHYFVDGTAFFAGAAMLLLLPLLPSAGKTWKARIVRVIAALGAAIVVLSGTPLPYWFYGVWAAAILACEVARRRVWKLPPSVALAGRMAAASLTLAAGAMELPWQRAPSITLAPSQTVYVIGDSISAGLDPARKGAWPELLGRRIEARVVNLAQAGAKVSGAVAQAAGVQEADAIVLVEIGGNDLMLTPAGAFAADLENLLRLVGGPQRRVFMIEVPSMPFGNQYGLAQRRLARKYGVTMIPRWLLVNVWATPGATLDGIHLSPAGHQQLATAIARLFKE